MTNSDYQKIVEITKEMTGTWRRSRGIAPDVVADKMDRAMFGWINDLTEALSIWIDKGQNMSDGELILAWVNLGSLVECWFRFFYCAYYEDYSNNPKMKRNVALEPDDKDMSFEDLKQYSNGILWGNPRDTLYRWVDKVQKYRNAIHAFHFRNIGTSSEFILDIGCYLSFIEEITSSLPPIEDYMRELLSDCQ